MWLPEIDPNTPMVANTATANAPEITPTSAIVTGAAPLTRWVAVTAPPPNNTNAPVPTNSAPARTHQGAWPVIAPSRSTNRAHARGRKAIAARRPRTSAVPAASATTGVTTGRVGGGARAVGLPTG